MTTSLLPMWQSLYTCALLHLVFTTNLESNNCCRNFDQYTQDSSCNCDQYTQDTSFIFGSDEETDS
jgi:hypothetical protein